MNIHQKTISILAAIAMMLAAMAGNTVLAQTPPDTLQSDTPQTVQGPQGINAISCRQTYGETNTPQVNFYYNLQRTARYGSPRRSDFYA